MGVPDRLQTKPHSYVGHSEEFHRCRSNGTSVRLPKSAEKWVPRVPPFRVTQSHRKSHGSYSTATMTLHCIISKILRDVGRSLRIFLTPFLFTALQRGKGTITVIHSTHEARMSTIWETCVIFPQSLIPLSDAAQQVQRVSDFVKESGMLGLQTWSRSRGQLSAVSVLVSSILRRSRSRVYNDGTVDSSP